MIPYLPDGSAMPSSSALTSRPSCRGARDAVAEPDEFRRAERSEPRRHYDVRVLSDGSGLLRKKRWTITGTTQPTNVSQGTLDEWVTWMVAAGFENGCEFDGWGAQVPVRPPQDR